MPRNIDGFDLEDLSRAYQILTETTHETEFPELIRASPILGSIVLHRELARLVGVDESFAQHDSIRRFFRFLYVMAHQQLANSQKREHVKSVLTANILHLPAYFQDLLKLLAGRLPQRNADGVPFDPVKHQDAIQQALSALDYRPFQMPAYKPTIGSRWSAIVVQCMNCKAERLEVRAFAIDLTRAAGLVEPLREGHMHASVCLHCGFPMSEPQWIWIQESPGPSDPLLAMSCHVQISGGFRVFTPPAWGHTQESQGAILEAYSRFLDLDSHPDGYLSDLTGNRFRFQAIAYDADELRSFIDEPPLLQSVVASVSYGLRSGKWAIADAMQMVQRLVEECSDSFADSCD